MVLPDGGQRSLTIPAGAVGLQGQFDPRDLNEYINPPPDPRLNSILKKVKSPLRHGIIQQADTEVAGDQQLPFACRFMFNPGVLSVRYGVNPTAVEEVDKTADEAAGLMTIPGSTSLGFSLLFDRTYEVAYGPTQTNRAPMTKLGVYRDIAALECVVGARNRFATTDAGAIQNMTFKPVYIIFGGGDGNGGTLGMSFIAGITSISVNYALFSANMVPTRCSVDIEATVLLGRSLIELRDSGGTLIDRAHGKDRVTTASGKNLARGTR